MNQEQQLEKLGLLYTKAWASKTFKNSLLVEPELVMKAEGIVIPAHAKIITLENTNEIIHFVIPATQTEGELSDAELAEVSGGLLFVTYMLTIGTLLVLANLGLGITIGIAIKSK